MSSHVRGYFDAAADAVHPIVPVDTPATDAPQAQTWPTSPVPDLTGGPFCTEQGCRARWGKPLGLPHTCGKAQDAPAMPDYSPAVVANVYEGDPGRDGRPRFYAKVELGNDWSVIVAQSQLDPGALTVEIDGPSGDDPYCIHMPRLAVHLNDCPLFDDREL